jgi:hypothetical protein
LKSHGRNRFPNEFLLYDRSRCRVKSFRFDDSNLKPPGVAEEGVCVVVPLKLGFGKKLVRMGFFLDWLVA